MCPKKMMMMFIELKREITEKHEQGVRENNLPKQALLILDNAPAHPPNLEDDLLEEFKFIKVLYLPPNTTPILQPMDQQVISNFKKLHIKHIFQRCFEVTENTNLTLREFWMDHFNIVICLRIIDQVCLGVTTRTLTSAWKKLWPEAVAERAFEGFEPEMSVVEEIVSLGKSMGLEVDERDVKELVEEQSQKLTTEELHDLHSQQHTMVQRKISFEEEPEMEEVIPTRDTKILGMWEKVVEFVDKNHPEKVATGCATELFNETCLTHFRNVLKGRKKQTSLDSFFKRSAGEK
ncbi:tigger transposable element-derived protein 1-like [Stegodyphus dumicola]|uniref:tigger transposable element-derived protein 1-like n=1 Tax=Stegodyphus dumicola TaxID=202533 RepID=UPI0015AB4901|nr:tigger transposable element-derived protein 1-like [Stegodyphus dumicola]